MTPLLAFLLGFAACYAFLAVRVYYAIFRPMGRGHVPRRKLIFSAIAWPVSIQFGDPE